MTVLGFSPTILRMTKPVVSVPLPHHKARDERSEALFVLENTILHANVGAAFRDKEMPLELIQSITQYLTVFHHPYDQKLFIALANETGLSDSNYFKVRNLIALTPPCSPQDSGGVQVMLKVMNGLGIWGFYTDRSLLSGDAAVQAKALMYVTTRLIKLDNSDDVIGSYESGLRRASFLSDPELAELVKEYPECHELITDTVVARQGDDVDLLRGILTSGSRAVCEGQL